MRKILNGFKTCRGTRKNRKKKCTRSLDNMEEKERGVEVKEEEKQRKDSAHRRAMKSSFIHTHVLSDLKFTYPTIFQSWQTGSVALMLLSMNALGYIELSIAPVNSAVIVSWLPASFLFSGIIYSGSVALSRLPVPVFCAMHYTCALFVTLLDSFLLKKEPSGNSQISLILTALATVCVAATDVQFNQTGYKWIMIHCGFSALYVFYGRTRKKNSLSDHDKMFYNAASSVVILMIICVATGELYRIIEFPFLYSTHFHLGCMGSGIFGAALGFFHTSLLSTELSHSMGVINSVNKIVISFLSLFIFDVTLDTSMAASIIVTLASGVLYSYTVTAHNDDDQRNTHPIRDS